MNKIIMKTTFKVKTRKKYTSPIFTTMIVDHEQGIAVGSPVEAGGTGTVQNSDSNDIIIHHWTDEPDVNQNFQW